MNFQSLHIWLDIQVGYFPLIKSMKLYGAKDGEHCGTAVASVIGQIRRKLTPDTPKGGYIRTVLGSGYKFNSSPFKTAKKGFEAVMISKPFLFFIKHGHYNSINYNPCKNTGFR